MGQHDRTVQQGCVPAVQGHVVWYTGVWYGAARGEVVGCVPAAFCDYGLYNVAWGGGEHVALATYQWDSPHLR